MTLNNIENLKLKQMILYIVSQMKFIDSSLSRTKMERLLFIADLEAKKRRGRTISSIWYTYFPAYGPFSQLIVDAINDMLEYEIKEGAYPGPPDIFGNYERTYITGPRPRFEMALSQDERQVLDGVLEEHGGKTEDELLTYIYGVPEMKKSSPLEIVLR